MIFTNAIRRVVLSVALIIKLLFLAELGFAQQSVSEQEVKAVFIYNFLMFVEWPDSAFGNSADPFTVGIAGDDGFVKFLTEVVKGETYKGRRIYVRKLSSAEEVTDCQILYIDSSFPNIHELFRAVTDTPVLTVGDSEDFLVHGGIIRFFIEQNRIKIEVNPDKAKKQGIKISSKLLRLAKIYSE